MQTELDAIKAVVHHLLQTHKEEEWLDSADMKMRFHFSESKLYRLRKEGKIPCSKLNGRYLYPKSLLNDSLMERLG